MLPFQGDGYDVGHSFTGRCPVLRYAGLSGRRRFQLPHFPAQCTVIAIRRQAEKQSIQYQAILPAAFFISTFSNFQIFSPSTNQHIN